MFTQTWRTHWGLAGDPFACEDADKDLVLSQIALGAVHSGFDRVFGDPRSPSPGIVFGEKGSGKSGLRLMMKRRLAEHDAAHPDARVFTVEYIDLNPFIEQVHKTVARKERGKAAVAAVVGRWEIADHLDAILSLGVTQLVDGILAGGERALDLSPKQKLDLLLLTGTYYRATRRTVGDALGGLRQKLGGSIPGQGGGLAFRRWTATIVGAALLLAPQLVDTIDALGRVSALRDHADFVTGLGAALLVGPWLLHLVRSRLAAKHAAHVARSVRVLPDDPAPLAHVLTGLSRELRGEFALPDGTAEAPRYAMLQRFLDLLGAYGYTGLYVLVDRVDEPTLLSDSPEGMREFVARMLDIKLLQLPRLALKLFLPIEMESLWHSASPEQLRRMRLDKSNLVPELKWTGRELYEIANQRLHASVAADSPARELSDLFAPDLPLDEVLETLSTLATPRYAFGFLSEVFVQYVKDLPDALPDGDPRWRLPRSHFEVVRAGWIDRTGFLRRTLN
ncbi:MAG: hypothetical protein H6825_12750 [Planctomycetes bacterium]|nr:hypothetical protein [Planctomycetota bacterium]